MLRNYSRLCDTNTKNVCADYLFRFIQIQTKPFYCSTVLSGYSSLLIKSNLRCCLGGFRRLEKIAQVEIEHSCQH